jgi:hypothetical protein
MRKKEKTKGKKALHVRHVGAQDAHEHFQTHLSKMNMGAWALR